MALATQCPHCQTTFRVVHDQLKLRAGLVRCGHCKEIFNGIEHLLPPPDTQEQSVAAPPAEPRFAIPRQPAAMFSTTPVSPVPAASSETVKDEDLNEIEHARTSDADAAQALVTHVDFDIPVAPGPETESESASESEPESKPVRDHYTMAPAAREPDLSDPLQRMTLVDFTRDLPEDEAETGRQDFSRAEATPTYDPNQPDALDEAIEDLQRKPWRTNKKPSRSKIKRMDSPPEIGEDDEPAFVKRGRRQQRLGKKLRVLLVIGCLILFITAFAQATYLFRNQIAGLFPQTKPWLTQLCAAFSCRIELPSQIAAVAIESSELQTLAENKEAFVLSTLLRNYSETLQAWPHIELTLNDANEKALLRRVFTPADYLTAAEIRNGFTAGSEHSVKLSFELTQIKASGYRVYLFYP
jgi:predicted Zn finger-like uncharacterized protein